MRIGSSEYHRRLADYERSENIRLKLESSNQLQRKDAEIAKLKEESRRQAEELKRQQAANKAKKDTVSKQTVSKQTVSKQTVSKPLNFSKNTQSKSAYGSSSTSKYRSSSSSSKKR